MGHVATVTATSRICGKRRELAQFCLCPMTQICPRRLKRFQRPVLALGQLCLETTGCPFKACTRRGSCLQIGGRFKDEGGTTTSARQEERGCFVQNGLLAADPMRHVMVVLPVLSLRHRVFCSMNASCLENCVLFHLDILYDHLKRSSNYCFYPPKQ